MERGPWRQGMCRRRVAHGRCFEGWPGPRGGKRFYIPLQNRHRLLEFIASFYSTQMQNERGEIDAALLLGRDGWIQEANLVFKGAMAGNSSGAPKQPGRV